MGLTLVIILAPFSEYHQLPNTNNTLPEKYNYSQTAHYKAYFKTDFYAHIKLEIGVQRTGWKDGTGKIKSVDVIEKDHDQNSYKTEERKDASEYIDQ